MFNWSNWGRKWSIAETGTEQLNQCGGLGIYVWNDYPCILGRETENKLIHQRIMPK